MGCPYTVIDVTRLGVVLILRPTTRDTRTSAGVGSQHQTNHHGRKSNDSRERETGISTFFLKSKENEWELTINKRDGRRSNNRSHFSVEFKKEKKSEEKKI